MHADEPSDLEFLAGSGVVEFVALLDLALVDANVGELSVLAVLELEPEGYGFFLLAHLELHRLLFLVEVEGDVLLLAGIRQELEYGVEQGLDALVLVRGTDHDRNELLGDDALADRIVDQFFGRVAFEEGLGKFVREHAGGIEHRFAVLGRIGFQVFRDLGFADILSGGTVEVVGLHPDEVDAALELVLEPDRELDEDGVQPELFDKLGLDLDRVCADAVALVDEGDSRDMVALELPVDGDRLGLNAGDGAQDENGAVQNTEGAFDLDREVHVAGGIDQVDRIILPGDVRGGGLYRYTALPLKIHGIHRRTDAIFAVNFMNSMYFVAVKQNTFRQGGLAGVDVGADSNIAHFGDFYAHFLPNLSLGMNDWIYDSNGTLLKA